MLLLETKVMKEIEKTIKIYGDALYKLYVIEQDGEFRFNVIKSDFKLPTVEFFNGKLEINIPASGDLNAEQAVEHVKTLNSAINSMGQIELIIAEYK